MPLCQYMVVLVLQLWAPSRELNDWFEQILQALLSSKPFEYSSL